MAKEWEPNEDWVKRDYGRIPTKGAAAADRASGGLGTISDDEALMLLGYLPRSEELEQRSKPAGDK